MFVKIPKLLHFIWFGDDIPQYAEFSIENFLKVNPDFEINFVTRTIDEINGIKMNGIIENKIDEVISKSINRISSSKEDIFVNFQMSTIYKHGVQFVQILSDVVRLELLNEFGGIYLDCDTFPRKPFDEGLLNCDFFIVKRSENGGKFRDNFFMGKSLGCESIINPYEVDATEIPYEYGKKTELLMKKQKFFDLNLKYEKQNDGYIYHFENGAWKHGIHKGL